MDDIRPNNIHIFLDTNAIIANSPCWLVNRLVSQWLEKQAASVVRVDSINVYLPGVVFEERVAQMRRDAERCLEGIRLAERITGQEFGFDQDALSQAVRRLAYREAERLGFGARSA